MSVTQSWQECRPAEFTTCRDKFATVVTAHGEIDAANANQLTDYVQRALRGSKRMVLDLRSVDFIGTAGFSALHRINVVCSSVGAQWALIPGRAVNHLLRICDPDATLPTATSLAEAVSGDVNAASRSGLLQLVPQPR
ncbi:sulfate transporter [Mycobacterium sp. 852002-51163_SCH5372311]|uniref:STAS domain-containing protein n=1 Tax=Mycobacterium sp. 852002-51163_SCH5372311 TaxID=1834097 RepID=UPI0007FC2E1B|nr:STAS domain-containing protein [Mycobacterium sp. 852002-51163_SCH5372311]OBF84524.1 sulfate transporter [Mycobacterium sp. 852002-51163_SCH5372311]